MRRLLPMGQLLGLNRIGSARCLKQALVLPGGSDCLKKNFKGSDTEHCITVWGSPIYSKRLATRINERNGSEADNKNAEAYYLSDSLLATTTKGSGESAKF